MRHPTSNFNVRTIITGSIRAKEQVKHVLDLADNFKKDPDRKRRMQRHYCISCHYDSRIGGSAMTNQACAACGVDEMYSSTATDKLCMDCAKKTETCKCCGGDIKMRVNRKN